MTIAGDVGRKATKQTHKTIDMQSAPFIFHQEFIEHVNLNLIETCNLYVIENVTFNLIENIN